jgi:hypothetical protein
VLDLLLNSAFWGTDEDGLPSSMLLDGDGIYQGWAHNFKNIAPEKQNVICKPRAQYAKRNCAAKINAENASCHKKM